MRTFTHLSSFFWGQAVALLLFPLLMLPVAAGAQSSLSGQAKSGRLGGTPLNVIFSDGFEDTGGTWNIPGGQFGPWTYLYNINGGSEAQRSTDAYSGTYSLELYYGICGVNTPAATTVGQVAGGSYPSRTVYIKTTRHTAFRHWGNGGAGETKPSAEQTDTISANHYVSVTSPASDALLDSYNVYVGTASGGPYYLQNASPIAYGTNWQEPASCPGTCFANSNLRNDTAQPPTTDTACSTSRDGHQDNNGRFIKDMDFGDEWTLRGRVKFLTPDKGALWCDATHWANRKIVYSHTGSTGGKGGSIVVGANCSDTAPYPHLTVQVTSKSACGGPNTVWHSYDPGGTGVSLDAWHYLEFHVKHSSTGNADGYFTLKWDGATVAWSTCSGTLYPTCNTTNIKTRCDGSLGTQEIMLGEQADRLGWYGFISERRRWDDISVTAP